MTAVDPSYFVRLFHGLNSFSVWIAGHVPSNVSARSSIETIAAGLDTGVAIVTTCHHAD